MFDHDAMITATHISDDLRAFATCSLDGKIQIYGLINGNKLRTTFHP